MTLYLKEDLIYNEKISLEELTIINKIDKIVSDYAIHLEFPIKINNKLIISPKKYSLDNNLLKIPSHVLFNNLYEVFLENTIVHEVVLSSFLGENYQGKLYYSFIKNDQGFTLEDDRFCINDQQFIDKKELRKFIEEAWESRVKAEEKELLMKWHSDVFHRPDNNNPEDLFNLLVDVLIYNYGHVNSPDKKIRDTWASFSGMINIYNNTLYLGQYFKGVCSCDGIFITEEEYYDSIVSSGNVPMRWDINLKGTAKPNLKAARNGFIEDDLYDNIQESMMKGQSEAFLKLLREDKIISKEKYRYNLISLLASDQYPEYDFSDIFHYLLNNVDFVCNYLMVRVFYEGKENYLDLDEVNDLFNGVLFITEKIIAFDKGPLIFDYQIDSRTPFVKRIIKGASEITFFIHENFSNNYFMLKFPGKKDFLLREDKFLFVDYKGVNESYLYVENSLNGLNKNHELLSLYKKYIDSHFCERLFNIFFDKIIYWNRYSDESFDDFIKSVEELFFQIKEILNSLEEYPIDDLIDYEFDAKKNLRYDKISE